MQFNAAQDLSFWALGGMSGQGTAAAIDLHSASEHLDELEAGKYFMLSSSVASGRPMSSSNLAMHTSPHMPPILQCWMDESSDARVQISTMQACGFQIQLFAYPRTLIGGELSKCLGASNPSDLRRQSILET